MSLPSAPTLTAATNIDGAITIRDRQEIQGRQTTAIQTRSYILPY